MVDTVIGTSMDMALVMLYTLIGIAGAGSSSSIKIARAADEAQHWIEEYNYDTIKNAIQNLKRRKLISRTKKYSRLDLEITQSGWKRIHELVPTYHQNRPWDGHLYLISYDIPTSANAARNILRTYIQKTGGALLQDSLWITPYNPTKLINTFIEERKIPGTILISNIGKDGAIGEETLPALLARVYKLDALQKRYEQFIEKYSKQSLFPFQGILAYLSILRDDPQLPCSILPKQFTDKQAYQLYTNLQQHITKE